MEFKDYYKTLGVKPDSSVDDIKKAYRKLARKYHPDVSKEASAEERFKEVNEAWEALKDPQKRQQYDQVRAMYESGGGYQPPPGFGGFQGGGFNQQDMGGFSDFFASIFGGGFEGFSSARGRASAARKGDDIRARVEVDLKSAYEGGKTRVSLPDGKGGQKKLDITLPKGITDGKTIRVAGQGQSGMGNAPAGDLYLEVNIRAGHNFRLDGKNVLSSVDISPWQAALGDKVTIETLDGKVGLTIPAGSSSGKKMRLRGKGMDGGDQIIDIRIVMKDKLDDEEQALYMKLRELDQGKAWNKH